VKLETAAKEEKSLNRFTTTRWSMILSCAESGTNEDKARRALADLCRIYWRPVFAFICRRGRSVPDAQDLTQSFFLMLLEGGLLQRADPNRGRFRSLLLTALKQFLIDDSLRKRTLKRGGNMQFVSWDAWMAEAPSNFAIPATEAESWPAEKLYDVRWAATAVEHSLRRLGEECESRGRRRVFDVLGDCLAAEREDVSYKELAKTLGVPETSVKRLLHQLRIRYRELLREEVAQTVEKSGDVDEELRYLCAALATAS
jgi:RNA polymerase sigma factor (sigma-70 family)